MNFRIGLTLSAAREKVRVANALATLPQIDAALAKGTISYSKVRALTRVAKPGTEEALLDLANDTTASQLDKIVRRCQRVDEDKNSAEVRQASRFVHCHFDAQGMLVFEGRLLPEEGALFMKALETAPTEKVAMARGKRLADALVQVCGAALERAHGEEAGSKGASHADRYQVIVHVDQEVLADSTAVGRADVGGVGISAEVARRLACDASVVTMTHDKDGNVVGDVGRRKRTVSTPLRRKLIERDGGCVFPGCDNSLHVAAHHVTHWANGGDTTLANLALLCVHHHAAVHERGFTIDRAQSGTTDVSHSNGRSD